MIKVTLNNEKLNLSAIEEFGRLLDRIEELERFELWLSTENGQVISMLKNKKNAWLMYLRFEGDSGFHSFNEAINNNSVVEFQLANGQLDEYPKQWCIEIESCYKALTYFWVNSGEKADWIQWKE